MIIQQTQTNYWGRVPEAFREVRATTQELGLRISYFVMGDENDVNAPVAVMLQLDPGASIARHSHPCERFEVITAGSLITEGLTLVPGDVMVARPGELYGPAVAGPDGATTLEVFSAGWATGEISYETVSGEVVKVQVANGEKRPSDVIVA